MKRKYLHFTALLGSVFLAMMACSTASNLQSRYEESKETFQGIATTASGAATRHPGFLETAGSFAGDHGLQMAKTAEAYATQNPSLLETAQALVVEQGSSILSTAQALATERPELLETAKALIPGTADGDYLLPDIPVPSSYAIEVLYNSREALSYSVEANFAEISQFYKTEMPTNGWGLDLRNSFEGQNMSSIKYDRPDRYASVTISSSSAMDRTLVVIYIENR
jgi:hypothetical protein